MAGTLVIRANAGSDIGLGHVMRTLAIAQAWRDGGGHAIFAMEDVAAGVRERLARESIQVLEVSGSACATLDLASCKRAVVLVDGYEFDDSFQREIVSAGLVCAVVDDHARLEEYSAHVVVDPNVSADASQYRTVTTGSRVLAGPPFALIRREFRAARAELRSLAKNVLVTFGGSDPARLTERTLDALDRDTALTVLVGGANTRMGAIERASHRFASARIIRDADDVATAMAWADIAVSAAGTTCSELAYMGLPAVVVIATDNQRRVANGFETLGCVRVVGESDVDAGRIVAALDDLLHDVASRAKMRACGRRAIDGYGAVRVVEAIEQQQAS